MSRSVIVFSANCDIATVSEAYDLSKSGAGAYEVEPHNHFYIVDAQGEIADLYATVPKVHHTSVKGRLSRARPHVEKRASYISCSSTRQSQLVTAAASAQTYAANSKSVFVS